MSRPRLLRRDERLFEGAPGAPPTTLLPERPCTHCGKPVADVPTAWCFACHHYTTRPKETNDGR